VGAQNKATTRPAEVDYRPSHSEAPPRALRATYGNARQGAWLPAAVNATVESSSRSSRSMRLVLMCIDEARLGPGAVSVVEGQGTVALTLADLDGRDMLEFTRHEEARLS
jgi:hypothetical protein